MKKAVVVILALLVLLSVFPPGLAAEPEMVFVIEAPETLPDVGKEFTVTVRVENNTGFNLVQFLLVYPNNTMTCKEIVLGDKIPPEIAATNPDREGTAALGAVTMNTVTGDGVLARCIFVVDDSSAQPDFSLEKAVFGNKLAEEFSSRVELRLVKADGSISSSSSQTPSSPGGGTGAGAEAPAETTPVITFTDTQGHWGEEFIRQAVAAGLFKGYPDNTFHPDEPVSRAQFVTVLWRLEGSPAEDREVPFVDIANQYGEFQLAIAWGYHQGYIKGTSDTTFSPEKTLTRQEALAILYRHAGEPVGMEVMFTGIYDGQFVDSGEIAPWAKAAMYWGVYHELIQGIGNNQLSPTGTAGRAQIAKIMLQYQKSI